MRVVTVRIEVGRGSFVKRGAHGIEFVSPVPCPFNYGSLTEGVSPDGDAPDALVLGPPLRRGSIVTVPAHGEVAFLDHGLDDPKLICGERPPSAADLRAIERFFRAYAWPRAAMNRLRGRRGATRYLGLR